jgi:hypothetical protein
VTRRPQTIASTRRFAGPSPLARRQETIEAICREARDLLLADGDPLAYIRLIEDPVRNLSSL